MDMQPPVQLQSPPPQVKVIEGNSADFLFKYYVLDRIDGPDIPDNVKKFANEHNCFDVIKKYYWSSKLFDDKGGVYFCGINGKVQYIYEYNNRIRFARWYEKHKFREFNKF